MIPRAHITHWRSHAPWPTNAQIEQDLLITRVLVELFNIPLISQALAFRGGTALHKMYFDTPGRYSEDIDLVQLQPGPIGAVISAIRDQLDPWLGEPRRKRSQGRVTIIYRLQSTFEPVQPLRVKLEINSREHFSVFPLDSHTLEMTSPWFSGSTQVQLYQLEELLGTKLRALYQRKKGRDLYDLWRALTGTHITPAPEKIIQCFQAYLAYENHSVTRTQFAENLHRKMQDPQFRRDIEPLLPDPRTYDIDTAFNLVTSKLISKIDRNQ